MMDITERANKYAEGKANEAITMAIAQAYTDGYRDGYKDREEEIPVDLRDNKTEYVDLGLPSGTLWATEYEKNEDGKVIYLPYGQASNLNLPTMEQWEELITQCVFSPNYNFNKLISAYFIGPNGKSILFSCSGYKELYKKEGYNECYFWIKDKLDKDNNTSTSVYILQSGAGTRYSEKQMFTGYSLPIRLVR